MNYVGPDTKNDSMAFTGQAAKDRNLNESDSNIPSGESGKSGYWGSILLSVITFGLITGFFYYLYLHKDKYLEILHLSAIRVTLLFLLSLAFPLISGIINTILFRRLGAKISYRDGYHLTAASTLANQLPVSGGIISKGIYLKNRYAIPYTKLLSAMLALFFCFIGTNGLIGLAILFYWIFFTRIIVSPVLLSGFGAMAACLFVFWLPVHRIKFPERILIRINQAIEGWMLLSRSPRLLMKLLGLQGNLLILLAARYWLAFQMLSQDVSLSEALLFATASILTQLVSIAPGGLGVREAIVTAIALTLGFDAGVSVAAVGLDRLISTLVILLTGITSMVILGKQISDL